MISKKLTSKAGITIPKALRADMGWQPNMAVDLIPQEDGSLTIRPHIDLCRFCGAHAVSYTHLTLPTNSRV